MLPQKLGLDVVVEKGTGRMYLVECNGEDSGYAGLKELSRKDLSYEIVSILGSTLSGKRVLVSPYFHELGSDENSYKHIKSLRSFGIDVDFSPAPKVAASCELSRSAGIDLSAYSAFLGLGYYIRDSGLDAFMVNSPAVEVGTSSKLVHYELLKRIGGLSMPEYHVLDPVMFPEKIRELQNEYGILISKPESESQGEGINVVGRSNAEEFLGFMQEGDPPFDGSLDSISSEGFKERFLELHKSDPHKAKEMLEKRFVAYGQVVQRFIETQPVIDGSGEPRYGCARLLWFDGYIGGYWRLSSNQDSLLSPNYEEVVNYSTHGNGRLFTPLEEEEFRDYANHAAPLILQAFSAFNNNAQKIEDLRFDLMKKSVLG